VLFLCEKKAARACISPYLLGPASVYNQYAVTEHSLCMRPSLTELEHGRLTGSAPQGAGVTGTVRSERPAADRWAGPFRPERTPFFPSLSSLRDSFHDGKNDIVRMTATVSVSQRLRQKKLGKIRSAAGQYM
jgi:hypothetical protein